MKSNSPGFELSVTADSFKLPEPQLLQPGEAGAGGTWGRRAGDDINGLTTAVDSDDIGDGTEAHEGGRARETGSEIQAGGGRQGVRGGSGRSRAGRRSTCALTLDREACMKFSTQVVGYLVPIYFHT